MKKSWKNIKVAVYYDWLNQWGGAEKVLLDILSLFPQAEIFTLFHDPHTSSWLPSNFKVHSSFIKNSSPLLSPLYDLAAESFDLSSFNLVISTTTNVGHCLLTRPDSLFVTYYHNLNRHLYQNPDSFLSPLLKLYQKIDYIYARRPDVSFCNSLTVKKRLKRFLKIDAQIINPGIDTDFFVPATSGTSSYFLIVSRLVPHKKIDYVIDTFKNLPYQLKIIGTGRDSSRLKELAASSSNIQFLETVSQTHLLNLYQNCQALISPQLEDFGLTALETQACGRPVIGYKSGGNSETVINNKTGILYSFQSSPSLNLAIKRFFKATLNPLDCRHQAQNFSRLSFMLNFKKELLSLCQSKKIIS